MKMKLLVLLLALTIGCKSTQTDLENAKNEDAFNALKTLVDSKQIVFEAQVAYPFQTNEVIEVSNVLMRQTENANGRFSLSANKDYLEIKIDSVKGQLSFFGELRTAGYSDSRDTQIEFDNLVRDYKVKVNKKKSILLSFKVKNETEQFNIKLLLFSNQKGNLTVYGSNRTTIRYDGVLATSQEIN